MSLAIQPAVIFGSHNVVLVGEELAFLLIVLTAYPISHRIPIWTDGKN
jgi:hypothetical protein